MSHLTAPQLETALAGFRAMLEPDGYAVEFVDAPLAVRIVATEGACPECLVPESVMRPIINGMLAQSGLEGDFALVYPADDHA